MRMKFTGPKADAISVEWKNLFRLVQLVTTKASAIDVALRVARHRIELIPNSPKLRISEPPVETFRLRSLVGSLARKRGHLLRVARVVRAHACSGKQDGGSRLGRAIKRTLNFDRRDTCNVWT